MEMIPRILTMIYPGSVTAVKLLEYLPKQMKAPDDFGILTPRRWLPPAV